MVVSRTVVLLLAYVTLASAAVTAITARRVTTRSIWAEVTVDDATAPTIDCSAKGTDAADQAIAATLPAGSTCAWDKPTSGLNCYKSTDKKCLVEFGSLLPGKTYTLSCKVTGGTDKTASQATQGIDIIVYPYTSTVENSGFSDLVTVKVWLQNNSPLLGATRTAICGFAATAPTTYAEVDAITGDNKFTCMVTQLGQFNTDSLVWTCTRAGVGTDAASDTSVKTVYCAFKDVLGASTATSAVKSVSIQNKAKPTEIPEQEIEVDSIAWLDTGVYADALSFTVKWKSPDAGKKAKAGTVAKCDVLEGTTVRDTKDNINYQVPLVQLTTTVLKPDTEYKIECVNKRDGGVKATSAAKKTPDVIISIPAAQLKAWNKAFEVTPTENVWKTADTKCRIGTEVFATTDAAAWKAAGNLVAADPKAVFSTGLTYDAATPANNKRFFQCGIIVSLGPTPTEYVRVSTATGTDNASLRANPEITSIVADTTNVYSDAVKITVTIARPEYAQNTKIYYAASEPYLAAETGATTITSGGDADTCPSYDDNGQPAATCVVTETWYKAVSKDARKIKVGADFATGTVITHGATEKRSIEASIPALDWKTDPAIAKDSTVTWDNIYSTKISVVGQLNTAAPTGSTNGKVACTTTAGATGTSPVDATATTNVMANGWFNIDKTDIAIAASGATPDSYTVKCMPKADTFLITTKEKSATVKPAVKPDISNVGVVGTSKYTYKITATNTVKSGQFKCETAAGGALVGPASCANGACTSGDIYITSDTAYEVQDICTPFVRCWAFDGATMPATPADTDKKPSLDGIAVQFLPAISWTTAPAATPTDTKVTVSGKANRSKVTMRCTLSKLNIGFGDGWVLDNNCGDDGTCTVTFDGLTPVTDYQTWCTLSETIDVSQRDVMASNPQKLSLPVPAPVVTTKTLAGALFTKDPAAADITYSSAKITAQINADSKKLQCYPVKGAGQSQPNDWSATREVQGQKFPMTITTQCGNKDTDCVVYLAYLDAGAAYTVWCRPEGVDSSAKKVELTTDTALAAGTGSLTYTFQLTSSAALDATTFKDDAHKTDRDNLAAAIKEGLKLPSTSTVTLSPSTTTRNKYTLQASNLKVDAKISNIDATLHQKIYNALVSYIKSGGLSAAFQTVAPAYSVDQTSAVSNPQDTSNNNNNNSGDSSEDGDAATSMYLSLAAAFFALLSVMAWL